MADSRPHFQVLLRLRDGSPLTIDVTPAPVPLSGWLPLVLLVQLFLLLLCTGLAVRTAISPLTRLVKAVEHLDPNRPAQPLAETGPREVAHAAAAFNAMQARIADHLKERMQLLAAISHDLQTPITRMKLRVEFMDASSDRDKLWNDLEEMQHLVREGVAYARSMHGSTETSLPGGPRRLPRQPGLRLPGQRASRYNSTAVPARWIDTRPHALRRVLVNLVDNALKFAGAARAGSGTPYRWRHANPGAGQWPGDSCRGTRRGAQALSTGWKTRAIATPVAPASAWPSRSS